jgi:glucosamine--fructose-6-phosphate aminotransferase (isomerizing)
MAVLHGRHGKLSISDGKKILSEIERLPGKITQILDKKEEIRKIARKFYNKKSWMFIGRGANYPIAREGALKLMEVAYISSHGYAAGEMRHGPLALISKDMPTVAIVPEDSMENDMLNNIHQILSSDGPIIAITSLQNGNIKGMADEINKKTNKKSKKFHVIEVPKTLEVLFPLLAVVPCQLLAYYCAERLGTKIDNPRNIAKCVTVS